MSHALIFLGLIVPSAVGFFVEKTDRNLPEKDWSHERITEEALLNVIRRYFEDHPPYGEQPQRGKYAKFKTAEDLWEAYYGVDAASLIPFKEALREIVKSTAASAWHTAQYPQYTFNNEEILSGSDVLGYLNIQLLPRIAGKRPDYSKARKFLGEYFYTLQSFYSNTNWVNMHGVSICRALGAHRSSKFRGSIIQATKWQRMCRGCPPNLAQFDRSCDNNLLYNQPSSITSGYTQQFGLGVKPSGKCGHGGRFDGWRGQPETGGINKETSNPELSPHWFLHEDAARAAVLHTERFLDGRKQQNSEEQDGIRYLKIQNGTFKTLLGIPFDTHTKPPAKQKQVVYPKYSLGFVIDITCSMTGEIDQVKTAVTNLILEISKRGENDKPDNYVLVLFRDPVIDMEFVTKNPSEILKRVNAIKLICSVDCEEMAVTGLMAGVELMHATPTTSGRPSTLLLFTDAPPKDYCYTQQVLQKAKTKGIRIIDFQGITPDCKHTGTACSLGQRPHRVGRSAPLFPAPPPLGPPFEGASYAIDPNSIIGSLALETGGGVQTVTSGKNFGHVLNEVIAEAVKTAPLARTAANSLPLMTLLLPAAVTRTVRVAADVTVRDLLITAAAPNPQTMSVVVRNPLGDVEKENSTRLVYEKSLVALSVWVMPAAFQTGEWSVEITTTAETKLTVLADTSVTFFLKVKDKQLQPVQGLAVQGEEYTFELNVVSAGGSSQMTSLQLLRTDGSLVSSHVINPIKRHLPDDYDANIVLPAERSLLVRVSGVDLFGNPMVREALNTLQTTTVGLSVIRDRSSGVRPAPGQTYKFQVQLRNTATHKTLHMSANSTMFTQSVRPAVTSLNPGDSVVIDVMVDIPLNTTSGSVDSVEVSAEDSSGLQLNALQHQVFVTSPPVVVSSQVPSCRPSDVKITCSSDVRPACESQEWLVRFDGSDVDDGIIQVLPLSAVNYSSTPNVSWAASSRHVTIKANASCCDHEMLLTVTDGAGQSALCRYRKSYRTLSSGPSRSTTTTSTTMKKTTSGEVLEAKRERKKRLNPLGLGLGVASGGMLLMAAVIGSMLVYKWKMKRDKVNDSLQQLQGESKQQPPLTAEMQR